MRTNAGADFQANVMGSTGVQPAAANYIALSSDATPPAAADTTMSGEINNAGGGINRAQAAYAHTNGTQVYTLTKTFTANALDGSANTIRKVGVFNAATGGTLVFETAVTAPPTLVSGDQVTITETVQL